MNTSRNICIVLSENDLSPENIATTIQTIERNPNKFYLLAADSRKNLWEVVDELSKSVEDDNTLTKMRIAYDLQFNLKTTLNIGNSNGVEVKTFADLMERLDFDENLNLNRADYHVIINDDNLDDIEIANQAVTKLFQQTAFLNIVGLDIRKKSDMLRPIRIAVFGTNKAGKSTLINNFLKREYVMTSPILPTPNTFKYVPDKKLFLEYGGKTYTFTGAAELSQFIGREYVRALKITNYGANLPNMTIHYPCDELTGYVPDKKLFLEYGGKTYTFTGAAELSQFIGREYVRALKITNYGANLPNMTIHYPCDELTGYEVWDTPGPNVAFTDEHKKNAVECIDAADVCIFVMNYSNYLTDDEVNFLQEIRPVVKDKPFVVAVNRIDERYAFDEQKSLPKVLDCVRCRLERLGYKNFAVFGTSALQNFYLDKVVELATEDDLLPVNFDSIHKLKRLHRDALLQIKFISDALGNLEDFHDIENATEKELYAFSGVPQLIRHVNYLGEQARRKNF